MLKSIGRVHLVALFLANILVWSSFLTVILFTNPKSAGMFGVVVLGASFVTGLICLTLFLWQLIILRKK